MEHTKTLFELHYDHKEWLSKLAFYGDELALMQKRIEEIALKNSSQEVRSQIEHFQNQLIITRSHATDLRKEIQHHEVELERIVNSNEVAVDHKRLPDHTDHRQKMQRFEQLFAELKKDLFLFLAKWM
jgi:hypothetical protein